MKLFKLGPITFVAFALQGLVNARSVGEAIGEHLRARDLSHIRAPAWIKIHTDDKTLMLRSHDGERSISSVGARRGDPRDPS